MHRLVVGLDREARDELLAKANPGAKCGGCSGEAAIVVALAAAQAAARGGEGHAGTEKELDVSQRADRRVRRRLEDAEGAGDQFRGPYEVKVHRFSIDPRQGPAALAQVREQGQQHRFAGKGSERRDGPCRMVGQPSAQMVPYVRGLVELRRHVRP